MLFNVVRKMKHPWVERSGEGSTFDLEGTDENGVGEVVFSGDYLMKGFLC